MNNQNDEQDLVGTANLLRQHAKYRELSEIYTPEGADLLVSVNLARSGVIVPPEGVRYWHAINEAAYAAKLDIEAEAVIAALGVNAVTDAMLGRSDIPPTFTVTGKFGDSESAFQLDAVDEREDEDEGGDEPGNEIFGYDNAEDNEEAAADYINKLNEI